jgi:hypothetical protein
LCAASDNMLNDCHAQTLTTGRSLLKFHHEFSVKKEFPTIIENLPINVRYPWFFYTFVLLCFYFTHVFSDPTYRACCQEPKGASNVTVEYSMRHWKLHSPHISTLNGVCVCTPHWILWWIIHDRSVHSIHWLRLPKLVTFIILTTTIK